MSKASQRRWLIRLLFFVAMTAMAGGAALILGKTGMDAATTLQYSAFPDLYFPGVILLAIVGGSALVAAIANWKRVVGAELATIVAAVVLLMWLVGEMVSLRQIHFLQIIYLVLGVAVLLLVPSNSSK